MESLGALQRSPPPSPPTPRLRRFLGTLKAGPIPRARLRGTSLPAAREAWPRRASGAGLFTPVSAGGGGPAALRWPVASPCTCCSGARCLDCLLASDHDFCLTRPLSLFTTHPSAALFLGRDVLKMWCDDEHRRYFPLSRLARGMVLGFLDGFLNAPCHQVGMQSLINIYK